MQWVDSLARLLDILGNGVGQQFVDDFLQVGAGDITGNDVAHLLTDCTSLRVLGVACLALGHRVFGGEANAENAQNVAICGLHINVGFNEALPFLNHRSVSEKLDTRVRGGAKKTILR